MKKRIALIFGGEGKERHISELSAARLATLMAGKYELYKIGISSSGEWYIFDGEAEEIADGSWEGSSRLTPTFPIMLYGNNGLYSDGNIIKIDAAIPCLHGDMGEDGVIQGALATAHIPYVGQDVYASAICSDKAYCKLVADRLAVPTAKWKYFVNQDLHTARAVAEKEIGYPMFIKPSRLGSSVGAHPVHSAADFAAAYNDAYALSAGRVMIEELISCKAEIECAFLLGRLSPSGIIPCRGEFYSYSAKYGTDSRATVGELGEDIKCAVTEYAGRLTAHLGIRQLARLDFFLSDSGRIYFNEINPFPGMTESSLFPLMTEKMGLARGEFIDALLDEVLP